MLGLSGSVAMLSEVAGHFFGTGPLAATQGSPHTIGGFEAHGLAVLLAVLLFRAGGLADRGLWHAVGLSTHLLLGATNILFWPSFAYQGMVSVGVVTTMMHILFVVAHAVCLWGRRG
jgi:hypothetical protein